MQHFRLSAIAASCFLFLLALGTSAMAQTRAKVIEYGWDTPMATYVQQNIRSMEQKPFDGLIMKVVPEFQSALSRRRFDATQIQTQINALKMIQSTKFTEKLVITYSASNMDWFSDADWTSVQYNIGQIARAAYQGGCTGMVIDPEPYGSNPWLYSALPQGAGRSFADYQVMVRKRGAQFMNAIKANYPNPKVMLFEAFNRFPEYTNINLANPADTPKLATEIYGLLPFFLYGMLDAATTGTEIIDGNEGSYYYLSALDFTNARTRILQTNANFVPSTIRAKYPTIFRAGMSMYVDGIMNMRVTTTRTLSSYLTPTERLRWFEHNLYHGMKNTSKFVWVYSERMNWWTNTSIPAGLVNAMNSAKYKATYNLPLGFEIGTFIQRARSQMR